MNNEKGQVFRTQFDDIAKAVQQSEQHSKEIAKAVEELHQRLEEREQRIREQKQQFEELKGTVKFINGTREQLDWEAKAATDMPRNTMSDIEAAVDKRRRIGGRTRPEER